MTELPTAAASASLTVSDGHRRASWNPRASPARARFQAGHVRDLATGESHKTTVGLLKARQQVEDRRLTCAVRPDETEYLAFVELELDFVDGHYPAVALRQPAGLKHDGAGEQHVRRHGPRHVCGRP